MNGRERKKETEESERRREPDEKDRERGSDSEVRRGKRLFPLMQTLIWLQQQGVNKLDN